MNDVLPEESYLWRYVEDVARRVLKGYGYQEIRTPLLERTELFCRSIGEITDIVEKEMYTFTDRNGESITLRPECTAGCVRAAIEHSLVRAGTQRLWAIGPMFRHERPQKGRYRQFHQLDVEIFGVGEAWADVEIILLSNRLWKQLELSNVRLELNSLGTGDAQTAYRQVLVDYFSSRRNELDEDSQRRLGSNPLRILDSKNPSMRAIVDAAPILIDYLDEESRDQFTELQELLRTAGVEFRINPRLVRGLDYYTRTVFEWVTDELGAQGTVCGGGRYDGLFAEIGGPPTPAVGFAVGLERLLELLKIQAALGAAESAHCYLLAVGEAASGVAHRVAERLRDQHDRLSLVVDAGAGSFKAKMKRANRSGARYALILGDDEVKENRITLKELRESGTQTTVAQSTLWDHLGAALGLAQGPSGVGAN